VVPRPDVEVRYSTLDVKAARATSLVAPAMVSIYAIDDQEYRTFDDELSRRARESVNELLAYRSSAPMLDLARVDATALISAEFYNRMDGVTADTTNYCLHNDVCTREPFWFGLPLTPKLATWERALGVRYVVFLRIFGAHRCEYGVVARSLGYGRKSIKRNADDQRGPLFHAIFGYAGPDGAVASAAIVDLTDARIVWFKVRPIADSRSISEMRRAIEDLVRDLS
jgi:hypothetical protein